MSLSFVHVKHMKIGMSRARRDATHFLLASLLIRVHHAFLYCIGESEMQSEGEK